MKIGFIIHRIGGEDGVALETEKWIEVLRKIGHEIFLLSGEYERKILDKYHRDILRDLDLGCEENLQEQEHAFLDCKSDSCLLENIEKKSDKISEKIQEWISQRELDLVIVENACALPINLSMSLGIKKAVEKTRIKTISHDHDFYWERGQRYVSSNEKINKIIKEVIPLRLQNSVSVVINSKAKKILEENYKMKNVTMIPNVMDFEKPIVASGERFLEKAGLKKGDIVLLQATRIVRRKGIETAIELVKRLNDEKVKLVITGKNKDEKKDDADYYKSLRRLVKRLGLQKQIIFAGKFFRSSMLFDAYKCATACTYFSKYEGFGNAFVEAVLAKKPIFVNNYLPVFHDDIRYKGFDLVVIENNVLTDEAVEEIKKIIHNKSLQKKISEHNFEIGKKYFSYQVLEEKLKHVFEILESKELTPIANQ